MQLKSGLYIISSLAALREGSRGLISRNLNEDRSLGPKPIALQPDGSPNRPWEVREVDSGKFILSNAGAPTCVLDNKLFAVLLSQPPPEKWVITSRPQAGRDAYTIETESRGAGWVLSEMQPFTTVDVRPLIVGPSEPPFFPPFELFSFQQVGPLDL
ncbi:hypothetical protein PVAG01_02219 [Phlyctema vagabunda]|uniref:Uncharacterized protein n=1 Tax=Phlyctema vagabunda TaxID=108571 RepID=A0ABR4PQ17_9HELO